MTARELVAALAADGVMQVTTNAVRQWLRETPPCPIARPAPRKGLEHLYDYDRVLEWLAIRAGKLPADSVLPEPKPADKHELPDVEFERARLLRAQAEEAELKNAIRRGQYIAVSEVERTWSKLVLAARESALNCETKIAMLLQLDDEKRKLVRSILEEMLIQLSNYADDESEGSSGDNESLSCEESTALCG